MKINSVLSVNYGEYFGFTVPETEELLRFYRCGEKLDLARKWYDGYLFGNTEVYNPWSMLNYTEALYASHEALPLPYWSNTSSNTIVKDLIQRADITAKREMSIRLISSPHFSTARLTNSAQLPV